MKAAVLRLSLEPAGIIEQLAALVDRALALFEAAGDDLALDTAHYGRAMV